MLSFRLITIIASKALKINCWTIARAFKGIRGRVGYSSATDISLRWESAAKGMVNPFNNALLGAKISG